MKLSAWMTLLAALVSTGCGSVGLHDKRTETLEVGTIIDYKIDAVASPRTIKVTAKSTGAPISVYIYLEANRDEAERMITLGKETDLVLASQKKSSDIALQASLPAGKAAMVQVASAGQETATIELLMTD